ncbi:MAG: hypothetical protein UY47_C0004G0022 [Parcubacteria group bacterium GW2011_GWB1_49_7]|uniref:Uncharacterized protein n=1 Tax=Candidatus Zambryskibacteria bacterium RIFCSPHIGHO2_01_FULL_46_25 TaxID=1802738 RepID=A0A1G2T067_9BACT|nr:MAG: hypothetical protein UX71_C0002G0090 [Parcubacteria group bacterium GW2011_GWA1_47_10]KKW09848.1 MAG: hypothetical protein UY47_C0004G0022 [Parcubacteria group bacterium GW2011_GWB1_49_7]OHA90624.1 MAG: hypothetical protein A2838_02810 [Candidatus Zambryskibacteria bacterium RIFCSPHIGHO2_01_FULL_46_25]OHB01353.1 MAG: hypothetical protein A3F53_02285 [Candidatus Zambryskibacteria bacterium RIFCSPHIGHO2_12_FULL_48_10]OHB07267.1 MAG: hypothetical protein A3A31_01950 [Candidatus Zambryskiba
MMRLICVLFLAAILAACDLAANPKNIKNVAAAEQESKDFLNYGNGVYYFPLTGANFGNALSKFLATHQCPANFSVAGSGTGGYGRDEGYWVVCR